MNNNIFEFILDYLKTKTIDKKYENFLNEYNVYNLVKIAKTYHYHFLVYYLSSRAYYGPDLEGCEAASCKLISKDLKNLKIELKKFYKHRDIKILRATLSIKKLNIFILKI